MTDTRKNSRGREYEKSGMYPKDGSKPFRMLGLLGVLALIVAALAGISVILDFTL